MGPARLGGCDRSVRQYGVISHTAQFCPIITLGGTSKKRFELGQAPHRPERSISLRVPSIREFLKSKVDRPKLPPSVFLRGSLSFVAVARAKGRKTTDDQEADL